jgi:hypothetical protein
VDVDEPHLRLALYVFGKFFGKVSVENLLRFRVFKRSDHSISPPMKKIVSITDSIVKQVLQEISLLMPAYWQ